MDELLRLGVAAALVALILAAAFGGRELLRRSLARRRGEPADDIIERYGLPAGRPSILYFWGERCVQCVQLQEPALRRLSEERGVFVRKVRAADDPELLRRFRILTVPSTVVIGPERRVRSVNLGFVDAEALAQQLA